MPKFRAVYSPEQRTAIVRAVLDHDLRVADALEAAARGVLPGTGEGLAPFTMNVYSARTYVQNERRRRKQLQRAAMDPTEQLVAGYELMVARWSADVETAAKSGDAATIAQLAKTGRELDALRRTLSKNVQTTGDRQGKDTRSAPDADAQPASFVDGLAAEPDEPRDAYRDHGPTSASPVGGPVAAPAHPWSGNGTVAATPDA